MGEKLNFCGLPQREVHYLYFDHIAGRLSFVHVSSVVHLAILQRKSVLLINYNDYSIIPIRHWIFFK